VTFFFVLFPFHSSFFSLLFPKRLSLSEKRREKSEKKRKILLAQNYFIKMAAEERYS